MSTKITPASIFQEISQMDDSVLPPVHLWDPPLCENVDMRIDREGRWYFMNSPIGRERMVKLFSRVLRFDDDGFYYLVTPIEKIRLFVEDKPFLIIDTGVPSGYSTPAITMSASNGGKKLNLRIPLATMPIDIRKTLTAIEIVFAL